MLLVSGRIRHFKKSPTEYLFKPFNKQASISIVHVASIPRTLSSLNVGLTNKYLHLEYCWLFANILMARTSAKAARKSSNIGNWKWIDLIFALNVLNNNAPDQESKQF